MVTLIAGIIFLSPVFMMAKISWEDYKEECLKEGNHEILVYIES